MSTVESPISKYVDYEKEQDFLLLQSVRHSVNVSEVTRSVMRVYDQVRGDHCDYEANGPYYGHSIGSTWEDSILNLGCLKGDEI
jgi:hypothetical protein